MTGTIRIQILKAMLLVKKLPAKRKRPGAGDIKYETWGFGLAYRWDANVKITAYYDMVKNESSKNLSGVYKGFKR